MADNSKQLAIKNITSFANSDHYQSLFKSALGKKAGQFTTSIIELTTNDTMLQQCDQRLVIAEAAKAATLDLPLNKQIGYAYVLTFKNKGVPTPTLVISARGWIQLAMRTGQYKYLNADAVYEGELEDKDKLTGYLNLNGERKSDKVVGFFAHFTLLNGFAKTIYMTIDEMVHYAKIYSPSLKFDKSVSEDTLKKLIQKVATEGPTAGVVGWKGDPISMAVKTVLKRLLYKYGYVSIEMASAMESDETPNIMSTSDLRNNIGDKEIVDVDAEEIPQDAQASSPNPQATVSEASASEPEDCPV